MTEMQFVPIFVIQRIGCIVARFPWGLGNGRKLTNIPILMEMILLKYDIFIWINPESSSQLKTMHLRPNEVMN